MNIKKFAQVTDPVLNRLKSMARRMIVSSTNKVLWQLIGYKLPGDTQETNAAENFSGIGFYSRPPDGSKAEAIVINIGGASSPAIVATRDERTRALVAGAITDDESMVYNSSSMMLIKKDGHVEIRSAQGVAVPLATKADIDSLKAIFAAWTPVATDGGAALKALLVHPTTGWDPVGTTKLKGE